MTKFKTAVLALDLSPAEPLLDRIPARLERRAAGLQVEISVRQAGAE